MTDLGSPYIIHDYLRSRGDLIAMYPDSKSGINKLSRDYAAAAWGLSVFGGWHGREYAVGRHAPRESNVITTRLGLHRPQLRRPHTLPDFT